MRVGVLGSGLMGAKLGTIFARAGHEVVFSYARSQAKQKKLARDAGGKARAGTPRDAAHWRMISEGDKVAARFTIRGTHRGTFFGVRCGLVLARRKALAWRYADYGHDAHSHSGKKDGKVVDWMEHVTDGYNRPGSKGDLDEQ